ncbi:MAG: hypothetical protein ABI193_06825 [Minicystis sp.]
MINSLRALACLVPLFLTACTAQVIGGTSGLNEGGGGSGGGGGGAGGAAQMAVAMSRAQSDVLWDQYWATHDGDSGSSSGTGGDGLDPNDLFLLVSDLGASCGSPITEIGCGGHWNLALILPPTFQQIGTYNLDDPALVQYSSMSETGAPNSNVPDDCSWGGGSLGTGTVEILALDASEVRFRITMNDGIWESDPSGEYTAPRCP